MRCPKCRYIGFDDGDRCRNCGYSFALAVEPDAVDLPIRVEGIPGPYDDLELGQHERVIGRQGSPEMETPVTQTRDPSDLPLFLDRGDRRDAPLVTVPPLPRPPVAVRRSHVGSIRPRDRDPQAGRPLLDLDPPEETATFPFAGPRAASGDDQAVASAIPAGIGARTFAGVIDVIIVGAVQAGVVYFTLRVLGLRLEEIQLLPPVPMLAFLLLLAGGYFTSFVAAGGQTIGKMAARIRVVPTPESDRGTGRVPFGNAIVRTAASLFSLLPAGAGLVPALLSPDRRAMHDRLADTRVVKG
jgi:uncharacterized RDD family membrane protein YckC